MDFTFATTIVKQFAFIFLVACAVFAARAFFPSLQSDWIVWSAFLLVLIQRDRTPWHCMAAIAATGLAATISAFVASVLAPHLLFYAGYCFLIVWVGGSIGCQRPKYAYSLLIIVLLTLLAGAMPAESFSSCIERALFMTAATLIVSALQSIYLFNYARDSTRVWTIKAIRSMRLLSTEIFACLLETEYPVNQYLFERRLHVRKVYCLRVLGCLRQVAHPGHTPHRVLLKLEKIFCLLLDCAQLRRRITDHTVFALCKRELEAISEDVNHVFVRIVIKIKNRDEDINVQALERSIRRLEDNYHHVLQITSREPLPFLLFINSLVALKEEMAR